MAKQDLALHLFLALLASSPAALGCAAEVEDNPPALGEAAQAVISDDAPEQQPGPLPPGADGVERTLISTNGLDGTFAQDPRVLDLLGDLMQLPDGLANAGAVLSATELRDAGGGKGLLGQVMAYLASCALPEGASIEIGDTLGSYVFNGRHGMAQSWYDGPLDDVPGQRWVSACLLAHANSRDKAHVISLRAQPLPITPEEAVYTAQEAAYFGNLFTDEPQRFACAGASSSLSPQRDGRTCGLTDDCGFTLLGPCFDRCAGDRGTVDECLVGAEAYSEIITVYDRPSSAYQFTRATFRDATGARSPGEIDMCLGKATCAAGDALTGLSKVPGGQVSVALCSRGPAGRFSGNFAALLSAEAGGDQRRAARLGDWAPGYRKLECGLGEYVDEVINDTSQCYGNDHLRGIQCASGEGLGEGRCSVRVFEKGDDRGTELSGEWDFGKHKGECGAGEYLAGVSVSPSTGAPHSLLCCAPNQAPIGQLEGVSASLEGPSMGSAMVASGWALDPDDASGAVTVQFYIDGTFAGGVTAGLPRPDLDAALGYPGDHGFAWSIPAAYRDNRWHTLDMVAVDPAGGTPPRLSGAPRTFRFSTGIVIPQDPVEPRYE